MWYVSRLTPSPRKKEIVLMYYTITLRSVSVHIWINAIEIYVRNPSRGDTGKYPENVYQNFYAFLRENFIHTYQSPDHELRLREWKYLWLEGTYTEKGRLERITKLINIFLKIKSVEKRVLTNLTLIENKPKSIAWFSWV